MWRICQRGSTEFPTAIKLREANWFRAKEGGQLLKGWLVGRNWLLWATELEEEPKEEEEEGIMKKERKKKRK